jgi:hypothetical protein
MPAPVADPHPSRTRLRIRDLEALAVVGRGYEVAQYQLHEAVFSSRSPNVVSRFVARAAKRGLLAERLGGIGMNRLRLTTRGREFWRVPDATETNSSRPRNGNPLGRKQMAPIRPVASSERMARRFTSQRTKFVLPSEERRAGIKPLPVHEESFASAEPILRGDP